MKTYLLQSLNMLITARSDDDPDISYLQKEKTLVFSKYLIAAKHQTN